MCFICLCKAADNAIPGYSVEEHTLPEFWFTEEQLGPWDWKIDCVQSGEIAYGKFLWGRKAARCPGILPRPNSRRFWT